MVEGRGGGDVCNWVALHAAVILAVAYLMKSIARKVIALFWIKCSS